MHEIHKNMKTVYCKSHILSHELRTQTLNNHCLVNISHVASWIL